MSKVFYEFQFTRKNLPYYVDVHAETVTEAVAKANTIDHDFMLVPEYDGSPNDIRRVCLKWDSENDSPVFTKEDICYIYGLDGEGEFGSIDKLPEEARK